MQHVTAVLESANGSRCARCGAKAGLVDLDSWRDLVLYVCTPLLIVPIFLVAQARWSAQDIIFSSPHLGQWAITCRG